jgi:hypothetical protein
MLGEDHPLYWDILKLEEGDILTLHVDYDALAKIPGQQRIGYMARTKKIVDEAVAAAGKKNPVLIMPTTMKLESLNEDRLRQIGLCRIWGEKDDEESS